MTHIADVAEIELAAFRAFPADERTLQGGFVPRSTKPGVARRFNSATTEPELRTAATGDVDAIVGWCSTRSRPALARMLSCVPAPVDDILDSCSWEQEAPTVVAARSLDLGGHSAHAPKEAPSAGWPAVKSRSRSLTSKQLGSWRRRTMKSPVQFGYASGCGPTRQEVAIGLGALDGRWLGIFDMYVDEAHRRNGHGGRILDSLLSWGAFQRCTHAYLQAMVDNAAAMTMYQLAGCGECCRYWYRRAPESFS